MDITATEEMPDIRFCILDTIFRCLAGTRTERRQSQTDGLLGLADDELEGSKRSG